MTGQRFVAAASIIALFFAASPRDALAAKACNPNLPQERLINCLNNVLGNSLERLETAEDDLAAAEDEIATLQGDLTAAVGEIATLQGDLSTAEGEIDALEVDLAGAQVSIAYLDGLYWALDAEVAGLGDMSQLESDVAALQGDMAAAQVEIATLQTDLYSHWLYILELQDVDTQFEMVLSEFDQRIEALDAEVAALAGVGTLADLADYVTVDTATDSVMFVGANVFVQSGSGTTNDGGSLTGLGNLIVGYDENDGSDTKSGSHNLVIGRYHTYTSYAGLVTGEHNAIEDRYASVCGGHENSATAEGASVSGGKGNTALGDWSSISGGNNGWAEGSVSSINGGTSTSAGAGPPRSLGGKPNQPQDLYSPTAGGGGTRPTANTPPCVVDT